METATTQSAPTASEFIDRKIAALGDWRGVVLARVRTLIHQAVPDVIEEVKWMGTPVWSCKGIICTGESYTTHVKLTFLKPLTRFDNLAPGEYQVRELQPNGWFDGGERVGGGESLARLSQPCTNAGAAPAARSTGQEPG